MSRPHSLRLFFLVPLLLLAACAGTAPIGAACTGSDKCASGICLPYPGGYCSADCSEKPCPVGQTCSIVGVIEVCLAACVAPSDCRPGYQCFAGGCQPPCGTDDDCGMGYVCQTGQCMPKPGAAVGQACSVDMDCSSQICLAEKCAQGCARDADCATGQTCYVNPLGDNNKITPTTHILPICVARRGTAAPGATCVKDTDCDRGSCQLGMCVEMCATGGDCARAGTGCATLVEVLDNHSNPSFESCLPVPATIDFDGSRLVVPLPSTGQSFAIYTHVEPFDFTLDVGVVSLTDPTATQIYTPPMTTADFYNLAIRYEPTEASSTMLVPNSPRITLMPGLYRYTYATSATATPTARVYMKLNNGPITSGTVPLNIYVTDLSGACRPLSFTDVKNGEFSQAIAKLQQIYQQANVTVGPVNFVDLTQGVTNTIKVNAGTSGDQLPDLDNLLQAATAGRGTTVGFDAVIVRSITDQNGAQSGVLGIAGGIPSNPVLGTAHSGVVVSLDTLCFSPPSQAQAIFGETMSHELGHSVGLFHSIEQDGNHDPLTDTAGDGQNNLMYWLEDSGSHVSAQQGQVVRSDPKVK